MNKLNKYDLPKLRGLKVDEIISKYPSAIRIILRELLLRLEKIEVNDDWLPTPENINALPEPVRKYIRDIETNIDPQGMVRENVLIKDTCRALVIKLEEEPAARKEFVKKLTDEIWRQYRVSVGVEKLIKKTLKEASLKVVKK